MHRKGTPQQHKPRIIRTMTNNTFQSSKKAKSSIKPRKDGQLIVDTATNFAVGIHGVTAATIYKYAKETSGEVAAKLSNKVIPGSGAVVEFILDTGVSVGFNEGLELIKDEKFDGIAEDAGVALVSNAAAAAVVGILGMSAAPALLTGLLVSSFMGAMYELVTSGGSIKDRALGPQAGGNQNASNSPGTQTQNLDDGSYLSDAMNQGRHLDNELTANGIGSNFWHETTTTSSSGNPRRSSSTSPTSQQKHPTTDPSNSDNTPNSPGNSTGSPATQTNNSNGGQGQAQNQNMEQSESNTGESTMTRTVDTLIVHTDKETGEVTESIGTATYTRGEQNEDGSYEWTCTIKGKKSDGTTKEETYHGTAYDNDNDGLPDDGDADNDGVNNYEDSAPTDSTKHAPNPMNDSGDTSNYDGNHDGLRDFRGDIDFGPDGQPGHGYNGEHDELIGFDPRIDYGPDGKKGVGYNGERDDLIGINPRIDWDRDHVDNDDFQGNELTERLGKINPRALQEAIKSTVFADNKRQAQKMSQTDPLYVVDTQSGIIYHNANGPMKGFGSGGAIAEIEIDQDLSLISVDFF